MLLSKFLGLLNHFLNRADHVEGLLRQSIILTYESSRYTEVFSVTNGA